jgi:hypothetical protein
MNSIDLIVFLKHNGSITVGFVPSFYGGCTSLLYISLSGEHKYHLRDALSIYANDADWRISLARIDNGTV